VYRSTSFLFPELQVLAFATTSSKLFNVALQQFAFCQLSTVDRHEQSTSMASNNKQVNMEQVKTDPLTLTTLANELLIDIF